jgi:hypothetical protein
MSALLDVYLAEYNRLKEEQRTRIGVRDNLIYAMFTASAAVIVFAFGGDSTRYPALLLLPLACLILGWLYLANDWKVSEIGRYFRTQLAAVMEQETGTEDGLVALGWETSHRECAHRCRRKFIQLAVDLMTFCGVGWAAVSIYFSIAPTLPTPLVVVSCAQVAALAGLAVEIIRQADVGSGD